MTELQRLAQALGCRPVDLGDHVHLQDDVRRLAQKARIADAALQLAEARMPGADPIPVRYLSEGDIEIAARFRGKVRNQ